MTKMKLNEELEALRQSYDEKLQNASSAVTMETSPSSVAVTTSDMFVGISLRVILLLRGILWCGNKEKDLVIAGIC